MKFKNVLFSFKGRIPRLTFILYGLGTFILFFILVILAPPLIIARTKPETLNQFRIFIIPIILGQMIVWIWIHLCLCFKRFQDCGKSGWISIVPTILGVVPYVLLWVVTTTNIDDPQNPFPMITGISILTACVVLSLVYLYLAQTKGTNGPNQFGPSPE